MVFKLVLGFAVKPVKQWPIVSGVGSWLGFQGLTKSKIDKGGSGLQIVEHNQDGPFSLHNVMYNGQMDFV